MIDKKLLRLLGENKKYIFYTTALMVVGLFANIAITASICRAIERAAHFQEEGSDAMAFLWIALLALSAIVVRYIAARLSGKWKDLLGRKVKKDLRERVYHKIVRLGVRSTDGMSMAGLTQVAMEGIEQLDLYYSTYIPQFFYAMTAPVILFGITVWIDWRVALVLLACVPLIPFSIIAVSKYAKKIFAKYWNKYTSMGDAFLDRVQGLTELKIFQADGAQHMKMNENSEEFRKITMKVLVMQLASTTIMDLVAYGGAGLGIAFAVSDVLNGRLSPFSALFLILVAVDFFLPLRAFGSAFHVAMNGASAGNKILSLLEQPDPVWGKEEVMDTDLALDNVTFSYDGRRDVLKHVNMHFPAVGMTAIVGESGCGKSTFLKLLLRFWQKSYGEINYNGTDIEEIDTDSLLQNVTMVSQVTYLFDETIEENLRIAKPDATQEELEKACRMAAVHEFILSLPDGYQTRAGALGENFSAGEKQRIGLARAFLRGSELILLDEPTSNVDSINEGIILKALKEQKEQKSIILVSHRESTMAIADRIYCVKEGRMYEQKNDK